MPISVLYITVRGVCLLQTRCKMMRYRERVAECHEEPPSSSPPSPHANLPSYNLAAKYGLSDDMDVGDPGATEQTVEQEYQAYITAPLSQKHMDIVKFWEASNKPRLL